MSYKIKLNISGTDSDGSAEHLADNEIVASNDKNY